MAVKTEIRTYSGRYFQAIPLMLAVLWHCGTNAQVATVTIDTTSIRIGEQVLMKLNLTVPQSAKVIWPQFTDSTFAPVEIVAATRVDTIETSRKAYLQYKQVLTITAFDSGYHTIPPVVIEYRMPGDTSRFISMTDSLILHVRTVDVDTTRAIRDIKAPMQAPITLAELWPYFTGVAIAGILAGFIWYYLWRRRMKKPIFPVIRKAQLPPWKTALNTLDEIEAVKLWQSGRIKEYYTAITDVLRTYLEDQHQIPAMEMISSEIADAVDKQERLKPFREKLWMVLQLADLVKFAKEMPLPAENQQSLSNIREFVERTKPVDPNEKTSGDTGNTIAPTT